MNPENKAIPLDLMTLVFSIKDRVRRLSKVEFAALLDADIISQRTAYNIRSGERGMLAIETLQALCDYFGMTVDVLTHKPAQPPVVYGPGKLPPVA